MSTKLPYQSSEITFTERKSRFIGNVFTVYSEKEAREMIAMVRELHDGANHVVYAYDVSSENATRFPMTANRRVPQECRFTKYSGARA